MYVAAINTPGYLPESDPVEFETAAEAWGYLAEERAREEDYLEGRDAYSEVYESLMDEWARATDPERDSTGAIYGDTPGYEGDHDLGLVYEVTEAEDEHDPTCTSCEHRCPHVPHRRLLVLGAPFCGICDDHSEAIHAGYGDEPCDCEGNHGD